MCAHQYWLYYKNPQQEALYAILLKIFFIFMNKGYWVKQANIANTDQFIEYIKTVVPWLSSVGGTIIAKDINQNSDINEWDGGQLGVIVEFESKAAAKKAFNSREFQSYIKYRKIEDELTLSIIG